MTITYDYPSESQIDAVWRSVVAAERSIAEIETRLARSPLKEGVATRLLYHEALATTLAQGELVHLHDLVLRDAGVGNWTWSHALSEASGHLSAYRDVMREDAATLLAADRPGLCKPREGDDGFDGVAFSPVGTVYDNAAVIGKMKMPEYFWDPDRETLARLAAWREVLARTEELPPALAAAIVWDSWIGLSVDERGPRYAPLLASLVLKARGSASFLLPINHGRRHDPWRGKATDGAEDRLRGVMAWMVAAAKQSARVLNDLETAERLLQGHLQHRRSTSKLPGMVALVLELPIVTASIVAKRLRVSRQAAQVLIQELCPTLREISEDSDVRVFALL